MLAEPPNPGPEPGMVEEPRFEAGRTPSEGPDGEQHEGRGGNDGENRAHEPEPEEDPAEPEKERAAPARLDDGGAALPFRGRLVVHLEIVTKGSHEGDERLGRLRNRAVGYSDHTIARFLPASFAR